LELFALSGTEIAMADETWNKNGEFSWDDKNQVIAYAEMLAHQVKKLIVRDRIQNYAVQYFAALVDFSPATKRWTIILAGSSPCWAAEWTTLARSSIWRWIAIFWDTH
jgi:hypothetical protein